MPISKGEVTMPSEQKIIVILDGKYVTILTANSVTIPRKSMFGKLSRNDS